MGVLCRAASAAGDRTLNRRADSQTPLRGLTSTRRRGVGAWIARVALNHSGDGDSALPRLTLRGRQPAKQGCAVSREFQPPAIAARAAYGRRPSSPALSTASCRS